MEYTAAFIIGLAGSFHCIGMCGPIAAALGSGNSRNISYLMKRITYNLGRVLTYGSMGLLFGFIGDRLSLFGLQRWLSVFIGSLLILIVILSFLKSGAGLTSKIYAAISPVFSKVFSSLRSKQSFPAMLTIGVMNGFLPCGFVYIAAGGAVAIGSPLGGAAYMAAFGLGTIPVMLGIGIFGSVLSSAFRSKISRLVPVMVLILGMLFVLRGLALGIPYLSPQEAKVQSQPPVHDVMCR